MHSNRTSSHLPVRLARPLVALLALAALAGCQSIGVAVWERDLHAQPRMQFDHQRTSQDLNDHFHFSREAVRGGRSFGGGGCGCN